MHSLISRHLHEIIVGLAVAFVASGAVGVTQKQKSLVWFGTIALCILILYSAQLITRSFPEKSPVDERLTRVEFLQERNRPVMTARFLVRLNRAYTPDELGHFRILLEVISLHRRPHPTLWLAARDAYPVWHSGGRETKLDGTKSIAWSRNPDEKLQNTIIGDATGGKISQIIAWGTINQRGPYQTIDGFDRAYLNIFLTEPLLDKLAYVGFAADDYVLIGLPANCLEASKGNPLVDWPETLSEEEQGVAWVELLAKRYWPDDSSRPPLRPPLELDFGKYTPAKVKQTSLIVGWQPITVPTCELSELWPPL